MNRDVVTVGLAAAAGLGIYLVATDHKPVAPRTPNASTGAPTNSGSPSAAIGGVDDYVGIHVAMRVAAFDRFGFMSERGPDGLRVPITPRPYALLHVAAYWQREINRLLDVGDGEGVTLHHTPLDPAQASFAWLTPFARTTLNRDSAVALLKAWKRFAGKVNEHVTGGDNFRFTGQLGQADANEFWDAVGRFAIAMDVDRNVPDVGGAFVFLKYVGKSIQELPATVGEAAREVLQATAKLGAGAAFAFLKGLLVSPLGVAVAAAAAFVYRAELGQLLRKVAPR